MRNFKFPSKAQINSALSSFSKKEKIVFVGFLVILLGSTMLILESINRSFLAQVPLRGGSVTFGVIGVPRFINPVLANSEADLDLVSLVYSGLMRKGADGSLIPDLASEYEISKDGLVYTFTLKNNLFFQDGKPVTADDVLFTVNEMKDTDIKSPRKVDWDGVAVEKTGEKTIQFTLKQPYTSFLENTTLGIMPEHLWNNTPLELNTANTSPIGSGPYMISKAEKLSSGIIGSYRLAPFRKFALGEPYIKNINLHFYQNESDLVLALENGEVDQIKSISPESAENLREQNYQIGSAVLPRVFGLFFNQSQNQLFTDKVVVSAINRAIDKNKIVREVLFGYGTVIDGPIPPNITALQEPKTEENNLSREEIVEKVKSDLAKDGWKAGEDGFLAKTNKKDVRKLQFSISTGNAPELAKTAELIKDDLAAVGIKVEIKTFETGNLNQNVIRPRKYDTLLFGEIINHESDLFAFWHSSQRVDPGLNVAMYTNAKVDKILSEAPSVVDREARKQKYGQFLDEIKKDMPAIFLYSPSLIYSMSKNVNGPLLDNITSPSDLYLSAYSWYTETENVWKIFAKR